MVEASAVRNAVISSALMSPVVLPWLSINVREPLIVDTADWLSRLESEVRPVPSVSTEAFVLRGPEESEDVVVAFVSVLAPEIELRGEPELVVDRELR